ncbi:hypothetical protein SESBI_07218 [Sesbania bispinosa]|nr:hypothetical protein SESBI_07218 [Sesbania bispinosa]
MQNSKSGPNTNCHPNRRHGNKENLSSELLNLLSALTVTKALVPPTKDKEIVVNGAASNLLAGQGGLVGTENEGEENTNVEGNMPAIEGDRGKENIWHPHSYIDPLGSRPPPKCISNVPKNNSKTWKRMDNLGRSKQ